MTVAKSPAQDPRCRGGEPDSSGQPIEHRWQQRRSAPEGRCREGQRAHRPRGRRDVEGRSVSRYVRPGAPGLPQPGRPVLDQARRQPGRLRRAESCRGGRESEQPEQVERARGWDCSRAPPGRSRGRPPCCGQEPWWAPSAGCHQGCTGGRTDRPRAARARRSPGCSPLGCSPFGCPCCLAGPPRAACQRDDLDLDGGFQLADLDGRLGCLSRTCSTSAFR
jgi:hypothetical protein